MFSFSAFILALSPVFGRISDRVALAFYLITTILVPVIGIIFGISGKTPSRNRLFPLLGMTMNAIWFILALSILYYGLTGDEMRMGPPHIIGDDVSFPDAARKSSREALMEQFGE